MPLIPSEQNPFSQLDKKRTRSPAYPSFGLQEAIAKAQILYESEGRHALLPEAIAEHYGYKAGGSAAGQAISALKQFGLLEEKASDSGRKLHITDLALDILLHEEGDQQRIKAIQEAALNPKIHQEIWQHWSNSLPPKDASLRLYLIKEREGKSFNKDYVDSFIAQLRSTIAFAKLTGNDIIQEKGEGREEYKPELNKEKPVSAIAPPHSDNVTIRDFAIPLISGGLAVVKVPVPMSELDFKQLTGTLTAWKAALVRKEENPPTGQDIADGDIETE